MVGKCKRAHVLVITHAHTLQLDGLCPGQLIISQKLAVYPPITAPTNWLLSYLVMELDTRRIEDPAGSTGSALAQIL